MDLIFRLRPDLELFALTLRFPPTAGSPWAGVVVVFSPRYECGEELLVMQNESRIPSSMNSGAGDQLKRAIQSENPVSSAHRIGILMSQTGRFLECISCRLSFAFPPGAHFDTVAKQFERHACGAAVSPNEGS